MTGKKKLYSALYDFIIVFLFRCSLLNMISTNISNSTNGIITNNSHIIANNIDIEINDRPNAVIFVQFSLLMLLALATIIGNTLVLYLITKHLKCTSFTNTFISSLSLSDLVGVVLCAPLTLTTIVKQSWIMGNITCVFNSSMNNIFGIASTYMLTCIVIDRYLVIAKIPRSDAATKLAHSAIVLSWTMAVALSAPWYVTIKNDFTKQMHKPGYIHCAYVFHIVFSNEGKIQSIVLIVLGYLSPVIIMFLCCARICNVIHRTDTGVQPASLPPANLRLAGEFKTAKTVLILVLVYVFTKLPYIVTGLIYTTLNIQMPVAVDTAMLFLFWTTGAVTPIVYANRNEYFSEFLHIRRQTRAPSFTNISQSPRVPRMILNGDTHQQGSSRPQSQKLPLESTQNPRRVNTVDLFNVASLPENKLSHSGLASQATTSADANSSEISRNNSLPCFVYCSSSRKGSNLSTITTTTSSTLV